MTEEEMDFWDVVDDICSQAARAWTSEPELDVIQVKLVRENLVALANGARRKRLAIVEGLER